MTGINAACGRSRFVIHCEVRRVAAVGDRDSFVAGIAHTIISVSKVVVGVVHVVLSWNHRIGVYQQPGLVHESGWRGRIVEIGGLRDATNNQPVPGRGTGWIRCYATKDVADKKGARHLIGHSVIDGLITGTASRRYTGRRGDGKFLRPD